MAKKASTSDDVPAPPEGLTQEEVKSVSKRRRLRAAVVYEIIRTEGEGELARTFGALWWSGLAAGISIGFSVLSQAMLTAALEGLPGAAIIAQVGYSVGFLIVILSRQQLFTENTLTAVLPVIARKQWSWCWVLGRLWSIVSQLSPARRFVEMFKAAGAKRHRDTLMRLPSRRPTRRRGQCSDGSAREP